MELFLDSSNPREIEEATHWGLLTGVTTNLTLIPQAGRDMKQSLGEILDASPGPVMVQVVGWHESKTMIAQAKQLHSYSDRIIVKLPISIAGIQALLNLKQEIPELQITVTCVSSIAQAYLSGKAGADIVALFNGPFDLVSDTPVDLVSPVRKIFDNYGFRTKILACGRFPRLFGDFAVAGADMCTMKIQYMRMLYEHPFTESRMNGFLRDWQSTFSDQTW
jgi:transaldolase